MTSTDTRTPSGESVGDIRCITKRATSSTQIISLEPRVSTVVNACGAVILRYIRRSGLAQTLHKSIARSSAGSAVHNHLLNLTAGARILDHAAGIAGAGACVILHQSWVLDRPRGSNNAYATVGFLHDDGEDETCIYA